MIEALKSSTTDTATSTAGGVTTLTYAAAAGYQHVISGVTFSYDGVASSAGRFTITDGTDTILDLDLNGFSGPFDLWFPVERCFALGSAVTFALASVSVGRGGLVGRISVHGHFTR